MTFDVVFPVENEGAFIAMAEKLGTKELLFVYKNLKKEEKWKTSITLRSMTDKVVVRSDPDKDRWLIEKIKPRIIYGFEFQERKDFLHHRNAALNHIIAKIMAKNNIAYGFPVAEIINAPTWKQSIILGRMQQNLKLCRKYDVEIIIASFASDPMDMRSVMDMRCLR